MNLPEIDVYQHAGEPVYLFYGDQHPRLYERVGTTNDVDEMVDHDGPILVQEDDELYLYFIAKTEYGRIQAEHPWGGRMPNDPWTKTPVILAREVPRAAEAELGLGERASTTERLLARFLPGRAA